jgi:hypothetical protein
MNYPRTITFDTSDPLIKEMTDRLRRIETRLTKFMEAQGFDMQTKRPDWVIKEGVGTVIVPTDMCSIKDILSVIPDGYEDDIDVLHRGMFVFRLQCPQEGWLNYADNVLRRM